MVLQGKIRSSIKFHFSPAEQQDMKSRELKQTGQWETGSSNLNDITPLCLVLHSPGHLLLSALTPENRQLLGSTSSVAKGYILLLTLM